MKRSNSVIGGTGAAFVLGCLAAPATAHAQGADYEAIVRIMSECAKIEDVAARVACYDNTIKAGHLISRSAGVSRSQSTPPRSAPETRPVSDPAGFGAESVRTKEASARSGEDEVDRHVRQATRSEPGIFELALSDGSRWRFVEAVPTSYDPPGAGSSITLARGALGSFQMRFANQRPVRVRRIQ